MKAYIFRHAMADFKGHAEDPAVTEEGLAEAGRVVRLAKENLAFKPSVIVSSPLLRARQTAEMTQKVTGVKAVTVDESLYGDRSPSEALALLSKLKTTDEVVIVSHMPLLSELLLGMIGGKAGIELPNGSIACVEFKGKAAKGKGKLAWLVPPLA